MRSRCAACWIALVTILGGGCATSSPGAASAVPSRDGVELQAVIAAVQRALVESASQETSGFPPLKSVTLKLQTAAGHTAGGGIRILVFSAGATVKTDETSSIEIEMKPPPPPVRKGLRPENVTQALAEAIAAAREGLVHASEGDPPLVAKSVRIELKFAVVWDGSATASVQLIPVGLQGAISKERTHTISLVFSP